MVTHRKWVNKLRAARILCRQWAAEFERDIIARCEKCGGCLTIDMVEHRCHVELDDAGHVIRVSWFNRREDGSVFGKGGMSLAYLMNEAMDEDPLAIEPWSPEKDARESQE